MTTENLTENGSQNVNDSELPKLGDDQSKRQFKIGDITWMRIRKNTWWPAQVFDEKNVNCQLKKKGKNDVLVRLYGTYDYYYLDPVKNSSEFENIVKQNNSTITATFQKALEEDLSRMQSAGSSKKKGSKSEGNAKSETPKSKRPKKDKIIVIDLEDDENNPNSGSAKGGSGLRTPPTARRIRVMRRLGLIAPEGSPYRKLKIEKK